MQGFNRIQSARDIKEALRRNKRTNMQSNFISSYNELKQDDTSAFLEWYVFNHLKMSPTEYLSFLQTQYAAEQHFRDRRQRNVDFARGRHFSELVYDPEIKKYITQLEYLRRRNIPPLTYNVISKLIRSLTGQFREINTGNIVKSDSQDERAIELAGMLTKCMDRVKLNNKAKSKDAMNFKEALQSGRPVFKLRWGSKRNMSKEDVVFRIVNPALFLTNAGIIDYDLDNLHTIMEIHDTSIDDIITNFANGDYDRGVQIRQAYLNYRGNTRRNGAYNSQSFDGNQVRNMSFQFHASVVSSDRYYEVWTLISDYEAITYDPLDGTGANKIHKWRNADEVKKEVEAENARRKENANGIDTSKNDIYIRFKANYVSRWFVIFLTPFGMVLDVRESPYKSGLSPFVFPPPDINGELWGLVEEVIPAQLSLDRQIAQADAIIANASKGLWLVPDTAVPDTHTQKEYLTELRKSDGAVIYKVRDGAEEYVPKQVYANSSNVSGNVQQLIQLYSGLVDEISGNYAAAQGKSSSSTATGYALESQNAGLNIRDTIENYLSMLVDRDELILAFMLEGYTKSDFLRVTGKELDPAELKLYDFRIEQSKGTNSPAHRLALEQELLQLVYNQLLPFEVFLDISNNPVMIQAKQKYEEWLKKQQEQQQLAAAQQEQQQQMEAQGQGGGAQQPADISGGKMPQGVEKAMSMEGNPMNQELGMSPMSGGGMPSIGQIKNKVKNNAV